MNKKAFEDASKKARAFEDTIKDKLKSGDYAKKSWDKDVMGSSSKYSQLKEAALTAFMAAVTEIAPLLQQVAKENLQRFVPHAGNPTALAASMLYQAAEKRMELVGNPKDLSEDELKREEERLAVLAQAAREIAKLGKE